MKNFESIKFVNDDASESYNAYDFSKRRPEDLMYIVLHPDEHTSAAVDTAKRELDSRNISIETQQEIISDAIHLKEIELASHDMSLSKNERILLCMTPPKFAFIIIWYYKQRGYAKKLKEMDDIPFLERLKYMGLFGAILLVVIVLGYTISDNIDGISSAANRIFE